MAVIILEHIIATYYANNAKKLQQMSDKVLTRLKFFDVDKDEFYSLADEIFFNAIRSYDGNGSEGLCQWTFNRKKRMQEYAKKHSSKKTWKSVDGQVAYLVYELQHSESAADKVLKNNTYSLSTMTKEFEKKFERAGVPNMEARVKYAKKWDTRMKGAV